MELHIGSKIKELRRQRNLTQEEMASHLGLSFQTISKWERNEGYPDITLLPALASYFKISIDELMGISEINARHQHNEFCRLWEENRLAGKHSENVDLMRTALREFPNDDLLLVQLASSLERLGNNEEYLLESAAVQEQILCHGTNPEIIGATRYNICFTYDKLGQRNKAIEEAKKLPNLYKARENALAAFLSGSEQREISKTALKALHWALDFHLGILATNENDRCKVTELLSLLSDIENSVQ